MNDPKTPELLTRPSVPNMDALLGFAFPLLDHGFIRVIDYMGDEAAIVQAARVSYGTGTQQVSEDRGLLRYLMRHRHSTPFEMCEIKLHVKLPIFVARQWIRHRTANVNEYSARFSILSREFYVPAVGDLAPQSTANKQGREGGYSEHDAMILQEAIRLACSDSFNAYENMIDPEGYNLSRELARGVTPMNTYTEWYWKVDLHNLMHFLSLRADPHAQMEIRVYADQMLKIVKLWVPNVLEAFEDYRLHACTFSRQEMEILRDLLVAAKDGLYAHPLGYEALSKREREDFTKKTGVMLAVPMP